MTATETETTLRVEGGEVRSEMAFGNRMGGVVGVLNGGRWLLLTFEWRP